MKQIKIAVQGNGISKVSFSVNDSLPEFIVDWFSGWITDYVNEGVEFSTGQTIQYGWSILQVQLNNGVLKVFGPDFENIPINWTEDLSQPISLMMEQKYVTESYGADLDICQMLNTSIVGQEFTSKPIIMRRYSRSENNAEDSGWFIGSLRDDVDNNDPEQLSLMSLYEICLHTPDVAKFLWLPKNYEIILEGDSFKVICNQEVVQPEKDSYVEKKYNKPMQRKKFSFASLFR